MIIFRTIFFLLGLLAVHGAIGQDEGNSIKASVSKNRILIGEPLELTVEVDLHPTSGLRLPQIDSIEHFEFLGNPVLDSSSYNESIRFKAVYSITSFDSGHWVIPSFVLTKNIRTDTIPVDVVFSEFDPNQEYHDIKDILEVKTAKKKTPWWWYVAGGAVLLALVLLYVLRKRKTPVIAAPAVTIGPYEEAMKQLEQLQSNKPALKQFHSELTGIFRLYIFRKKGILSLQKTTDDLVVQLRNLDMTKDQFDRLSQSLRLSDFVKFAKYVPSNEDDKMVFEEIKNAIITIEKTETRHTSGTS